MELALLLRSAARTATASQITKHGRSDAHAHPATAPTQAQPAGGGQPNIQTATRVVAALDPVSAVPNARHLRPQDGAERSNGPDGCWLFGCSAPHPLCMRRGAQRPADQGSRLSERSETKRVRARPRWTRAPQVAPLARRAGGDAACRVAFSLVTFSWRRKRKLLRRRAHTPASALGKSKQHDQIPGFDKLSPNGGGVELCPGFDKLSPNGGGGVDPRLRQAQPERLGWS